jgi:hypothetical protein
MMQASNSSSANQIGHGIITGRIRLIGRNVDVLSQLPQSVILQTILYQCSQLSPLFQSFHPLEIHQTEPTTATGFTTPHAKPSHGNAISSQLSLLSLPVVAVKTKPPTTAHAHATAPMPQPTTPSLSSGGGQNQTVQNCTVYKVCRVS